MGPSLIDADWEASVDELETGDLMKMADILRGIAALEQRCFKTWTRMPSRYVEKEA